MDKSALVAWRAPMVRCETAMSTPLPALHPNPFIQSLQNTGVDWSWPDAALSLFWRATQEAMSQSGWPSHSTPWRWPDVHAAYVHMLEGPSNLSPMSSMGPRLEPCIAAWLSSPDALSTMVAMDMLATFYLPKVNLAAADAQTAVFWAAVLRFCTLAAPRSPARALEGWCARSPHAGVWQRAHGVVAPFALPLWQEAAHMHRLVVDGCTTESFDIQDLVVV